ncbi:MAG: thioredoxin family protein [Calditrichia bacterium]
MTTFFPKDRILAGYTYDQFLTTFENSISTANPTEDELADHEMLKLNLHRSKRVAKTAKISPELQSLIEHITEPQLWMVLTEDWCGDSAQTLPQIARIAEMNPLITLRILPRDENLDIMDRYLTNGGRAIPKLVAFSEDGVELFTWGPRPEEARKLVKKNISAETPKDEWQKELHLWYARNRGIEVDREFVEVLESEKASI